MAFTSKLSIILLNHGITNHFFNIKSHNQFASKQTFSTIFMNKSECYTVTSSTTATNISPPSISTITAELLNSGT